MLRWLFVACVIASGCTGPQRMTKAASALYVRADSDHTTIVTPSANVAASVARATAIEAAIEIDAWSGASVDVVTAATSTIREVRSEATAGVTQTLGSLTLTGSYRYSTEPDYHSHGVVLGGTLELARKNTTLSAYALGSLDSVGRAGDPFFDQRLASGGARVSLAQLLGKRTLAELTLEAIHFDGFQASPYRYVAIGGDGVCASSGTYCVPEQAPEQRLRASASLRARRALGRAWSLGLEYRLYGDTWGVRSHTVEPELAWRVGERTILALRYRYYTQGEASFYQPRYPDLMSRYVTRDRKLSAFYSHEAGLSYLQRVELCEGDRVIVLGVRATASVLDYLAFVGLDRVLALETTALVGLELP